MNVLPSAPHEESSLYPQLSQHDFRMQKTNEVSAALNAEVAHYRVVAKNINVPRKLSTGAPPVQVFFQRYFQERVLAPLFLLLVFLPQYRLAVLVEHSLLLLQG